METHFKTFEEYLAGETFASILPVLEENLDYYKKTLLFLDENVLQANQPDLEDVVYSYANNFKEYSELLSIGELIEMYNECSELLVEHEILDKQYTDEDFRYNGFIKSEYVIHRHDSKRAPLHFDFRFKTEFGTSAYSFVLLKCKIPEGNERLLCKQQPMHPPQWVDMDHTQIGEGYGQGSVSTVDRGTIYYKRKDKSFNLYLVGKVYNGAYHLINIRDSLYLIFKAAKSILVDKEERTKEWFEYAQQFLSYLKKTIARKFNITLNLLVDGKTYEPFEYTENLNKSNNVPIPPINLCIDIEQKNDINKIISEECNIRNIEDIMRLLILRNSVSPRFFEYLANIGLSLEDIYDDVREIPYTDPELETIKNMNFTEFKKQKVYRMFSDIYMGHKFYGQFDFERYLAQKIMKLTSEK